MNLLGFIIHLDKSIFLPKHEITFLGLNINSQKIEITLTDKNKETLKACCSEIKIIKLLGIKSNWLNYIKSPRNKHRWEAHYKYLEHDKTNALKISKGCFDVTTIVFPQSVIDVQWCYSKINCSKNNIKRGEPIIEISSYASSFGWEAVCNNIGTEGAFNLDEMEYHINAK